MCVQDNKTKLIGLIVIALLAVAGTGTVIMLNNQPNTTDTAATADAQDSNATTNSKTTAQQTTNATYTDGTYNADGSYRSPGGTQTVKVKVTLANNTITAVEVTGDGNGESAQYQSMFEEGISDVVVGKNIDEIQVSRVSGSSLTSTGFNNAIETIKKDATTAA